MANYTQGLIIDGTVYKIPLVSIKRTFDFLEKYANRTEDGDLKIETIGGYQNYTVSIGTINDPKEYQKLYNQITDAAKRFHRVILPDSTATFEFYGYFSGISDEIDRILDDSVEYKNLTWKMTSKKPTRRGNAS